MRINLKDNQFGVVGVIEILLVVVLISAVSFTVWRVNSESDAASDSNENAIEASELTASAITEFKNSDTKNVVDTDEDGIPLCDPTHDDSLDASDDDEGDEVDELDECENEDEDHDHDNDGIMDDDDDKDDDDHDEEDEPEHDEDDSSDNDEDDSSDDDSDDI